MKKYLLLFCALLTTIGLKASVDLQPTNITPEEGSTYLVSESDGNVVFTFPNELTVEKAYIIPATGNPVEITNTWDSYVLAYFYYCGIGKQMRTLIKEGKINVGEEFKVQLQGIKDGTDASISYNDVSVTLIAGKLPAELVEIKPANGETINSYYATGDAAGLIKFTFTEPVKCSSAKIAYGDVEGGSYGTINLPTPEVEGSTVILNIQGIKLSPNDINKQTAITIQLSEVKTTGGIRLEGNIPGSPGVYGVNYQIKSSSVEVSYRFNPETGSNIDDVERLRCYFSYPITFGGVKLTYTLGGGKTSIVIPEDKITKEDDPYDTDGAFFAYIPIKDLSFDEGAVDVEFVDAMDSNGSAVEVKGSFVSAGKHADVTTCLSITPTPGTTLVPRPESFVFTFSDVVTMDYVNSVLFMGDAEMPLARLAQINKNVVTIGYNSTMNGDLTFKMRLTNTAGNPITYGETEGYVTASYSAPSDIFTCSNIVPATGKVESLKIFTLTFNGVDKYDYVGGFDTTKEISLKNEAGEKVTTGTITIPKDYNTYPFDAIITLKDEVIATGIYTLTVPEKTAFNSPFDEMQPDFGVSMGAIYNPELSFTYTIGDIEPTICTDINPTPEKELDVIPAQFAFTFSRNVEVDKALMTNDNNPRGGEDISAYVKIENNVVTITLPEGSTNDYTMLNLMLQVKDVTGAYVTYGNVEDYVVAEYAKKVEANTFVCSNITPAEGTVVSLKVFTLTFVGMDEFDGVGGFDTTKEIILKNAAGEKQTTGTIDLPTDMSKRLDAIITLAEEVSEEGTFTLVIPEQTIYNSAYYPEDADFGVANGAVYNPELTYTYTIQASGIDSIQIGELSGIVEVYSIQGVLLRKADISEALEGLAKGIYIVNGKKIAVK